MPNHGPPSVSVADVMAMCQAAEDAVNRAPAESEAKATQSIELAEALGYDEALGIALLTRAEAHYRQARYHNSNADAVRAIALYQKLGLPKFEYDARELLGMNFFIQGQLAEAIEQLEICIKGRKQLGLDLQLAGVQANLGIIYRRMGDQGRALAIYIECLEVFRNHGRLVNMGPVLVNIGQIHTSLGDHVEALQAFNEAYEYLDQAGATAMRNNALFNIGAALFNLERYDEALSYLQRCRDAQFPDGDPYYAANCLGFIGRVLQKQGEMAQAEEAFRTCIAERKAIRNMIELPSTCVNLAELLLCQNAYQEALDTLAEAQAVAQSLSERLTLSNILSLQAQAYAALERFADAYQAERQAADIRQEVLNADSIEKLRNLQVLHQLDSARHQAETLRLQAEQLSNQLEHQSRELTLLTLNMIQKNNMLKELRQAVKDAERTSKNPATMRPQAAALRDLAQKLDQDHVNSKQQAAFEEQFVQINEGFLRRLAQSQPNLSSAELKICALIRNGLSNKEIANLTYTTVRNVESHRYRIRKKMTLDRNDTLHTFLLNL